MVKIVGCGGGWPLSIDNQTVAAHRGICGLIAKVLLTLLSEEPYLTSESASNKADRAEGQTETPPTASKSSKRTEAWRQRLARGLTLGPVAVRRLLAFSAAHLKALVLVGWILLSIALALLSASQPLQPSAPIGIDGSWQLGLADSLQRGRISGRDYFFNYGPLWQLILLLGTSLNRSDSVFDGLPWFNLLPQILCITLFALALALIRQLSWKYTLFIVAALTFFNLNFAPAGLRPVVAVFMAVGLARIITSTTERKQLIGAGLLGFGGLLAQLLTVELGLYAIASATLVLLLYTFLSRFPSILKRSDLLSPRKYLLMLTMILGGFLLGNLLISLLFKLTSPDYKGLFDYQIYSLEIIRGYVYTMPFEWAWTRSGTIVLALLVLYSGGYLVWQFTRLKTADGYLLVSLGFCALLQLKEATIRSDVGHIVLAAVPLAFFFLLLGHDWLQNGQFKFGWLVLLLAFAAVWPDSSLEPLHSLAAWADGKTSLTAKIHQITSTQTGKPDFVPEGLEAALDPQKAVLAFPNETYLGVALAKKWLNPTLQSYAAHTPSLQQKFVELIDQQKESKQGLEVIYGLEPKVEILDGMQQITRTPIIFEYLYQNFQLKTAQTFGDGSYIVLAPRPQPIIFDEKPLDFRVKADSDPTLLESIELNQLAQCNLLRLIIKVDYPILSLLGRPSALHLRFWSGSQPVMQARLVALEPGKPFSTFVSLTYKRFQNIFSGIKSSDQSSNIEPPNVEWNRLQVALNDQSFLGVVPSRVEISQINCI